MKRALFLALLVLMAPPSFAQQESPLPIAPAEEGLNIYKIKPGWWKDFSALDENLNGRIEELQVQLKTVAKTLSPKNRKRAATLINKIELNLKAYTQAVAAPQPNKPPPPVISESYSIEELLQIHRAIRRQGIELRNLQDEKSEKGKQLQDARELLIASTRQYTQAEARSEQKFLFGLEIIAATSGIAVMEENQRLLESSAAFKKEEIAHLEEELNAALTKLVTADLDLFLYAQKVKVAEDEWEKAQSALKAMEARIAEAHFEGEQLETNQDYLKLAQLEDQAEIKAALAHNQYILAQVELGFSRIITDSENVDLEKLAQRVKKWQSLIALFNSQANDWTIQAERQLQQMGQLLFFEETKKGKEKAELPPIQQEIIRVAQGNLLLIQKIKNETDDNRFLLKELDKRLSKQIGGSRRWLQESLDFAAYLYRQSSNLLSRELFFIGKTPITLFSILQFFIIIIATIWISRILLRGLSRVARKRKGVRKSVVYSVTRLINYLMLVVGVIIALSVIGFDFSNLVIIIGALGVGLGFGLQTIFNNFISGIIILFESQLKVGDYIELETGLRGEIREINVRSTVITDNDGIDVLIPNAEIINHKVLNWTMKVPYRRIQVPFSVAYGTDKELVAKLVIEAAKKVPYTLDRVGVPAPSVRLIKLGDNGLEFELVIWVKEKLTKRSRKTRSEYLWEIETALSANNITIPFPQRDVRIIPHGTSEDANSRPSPEQE